MLEGLPIALTASLNITAMLNCKNKILCKSLKTIEILGAVSVISSDKAGTLTKIWTVLSHPCGHKADNPLIEYHVSH